MVSLHGDGLISGFLFGSQKGFLALAPNVVLLRGVLVLYSIIANGTLRVK